VLSACALIAVSMPSAGAVVSATVPVKAKQNRYALGDSVMLGARQDLKELGFDIVDAKESRQAYDGPKLIRSRGAALPTNVVVHLGTNGTYPLDVCRSIVKAAGPERRVFLVTVHVPRSWKKANNQVMRDCDASFAADRVHVIDWDRAASSHPNWLWSDNIHLRPSGARGFARLIDQQVDAAIEAARIAAINNAGGTGTAGTHPA
jgi:hypothetical protein